jgi:uncharacterized glyoxalase superfamily protein PhnB
MPAIVNQQAIFPTLRYADASAAIRFLTSAFGFRVESVTSGPDNTIAHAELSLRGGVIMLGSKSTQPSIFDSERCCLFVAIEDPDEHHAQAVAAGAEIVMPLTDQEYGSREYAARDPQANVWVFGTYHPTAAAD